MTLAELKHLWASLIDDASHNIATDVNDFKALKVVIHNATWCPDCEREVSELLALDAQAIQGFDNITLYSYEDKADYKQRKAAAELPISCLPTLIFYRADQEVLCIKEDSAGQLSSLLQQLNN